MELRDLLRLYVVTDRELSRGRTEEEVVLAAIDGGATAVQLRAKHAGGLEMYRLAVRLRDITSERGVLFIVNDRLDIALAAGADGVHLGQEDLPAVPALKVSRAAVKGGLLPGGRFVVGISAENLEQALAAERDGADYIGASPVWATPTKPDAGPPMGLSGLREICSRVNIPVVAIGGVNHKTAADVLEAGAAGLAVVSAVVSAPDVREAARSLALIIREHDSRRRQGPGHAAARGNNM
ncbi:MAG: thiamine phosphate synthase [Firmicutes bacterium]|jgi:thiamine-phosphate pyrophosphorylase|nr:thiamine phosphate synthase [Bacillota bacterium]